MDKSKKRFTGNFVLKRNDILLFTGALVFALILFFFTQIGKKTGTVAVVTVNGSEKGRFLLSEEKTVVIPGTKTKCVLEIKDGKVFMAEAGCQDKVCVKQGRKSQTGERIICIPNGVVVEIIGDGEPLYDSVVQ